MENLKIILLIMSVIGMIITSILLYVHIKKRDILMLYLGGLFNGISLGFNLSYWLVKFIAN